MCHNSLPKPDESSRNPVFSDMQTIKRRFFAMRNGALAAQMRAGGLVYKINFGLNLPQIREIASEIMSWNLTDDSQCSLAENLWANTTTRESMLIAPMIYPTARMNRPSAMQWACQAQTTEIADTLCHSLLRKLPFAGELASELLSLNNQSDMTRYTALRLWLNLLVSGLADTDGLEAAACAERDRSCPLTRSLTRQILDEIDFLKSE